MEPLHPRDREALKRAHPGLTDTEIDRTEELIAEVQRLDAIGRLAEAADKRVQLSDYVRERIPRYGEVMRDIAASRGEEMRRRRIPPRVYEKPR